MLLKCLNRLVVAAAGAALLFGCGSASEDADSGTSDLILSSLVVLNSPPEFYETGRFGRWSFSFESDGDVVQGTSLDGEETLTVPGEKIMYLAGVSHLAVNYMLVGTLDTQEVWTLYRYNDSDADGWPDVGTQSQLFSTGSSPAYVTSVAVPGNVDTMYFLDRRCQDVYIARDSNADGWPDTVNSTPFAAASAFTDLDDARLLGYDGDASQLWSTEVSELTPRLPFGTYSSILRFTDSNQDDVADTAVLAAAEARTPRVSSGRASSGESFLSVYAGSLPAPKTAQIWDTDSSGARNLLLGSGSVSEGAASAIVLSRALVADELLEVLFTGNESDALRLTVAATEPDVRVISPLTIDNNTQTAITITGMHFTSAMSLMMKVDGDLAAALAFTYVSSTEVTATMPAHADGGGFVIWAEVSGDPTGGMAKAHIKCP